MKYKLYTEKEYDSVVEKVLKGRGIDDVSGWLNSDMSSLSNWNLLTDIAEGVNTLFLAIEHNLKAALIVDCDVDGYTSSAILVNFLYSLYPNWVLNNLKYYHHTGKQHGLNDMRDIIDKDTKIIICPDSSSNDYEEHEYWGTLGVDIIILDHHEADYKSKSYNTVTINNQLCDYPNKAFSGAGIVWQFCKAYNNIKNLNGKIDTDLAALGNCGDMMSFKSNETKAFISEGFNHINNKFFKSMTENNSYTLNKYGGASCYKAQAFAVVPFINAVVRSGTEVEKDIVFQAMCDPWCGKIVDRKSRGKKIGTWPLYEEAVYITGVVKRRQQRLEEESMALLEKKIKNEDLLKNSVLVCCCEPGEVEPNIRGLAANKLASKYQRPCLVLTKTKTKDDKEYFYRGSLRNYGMCEIQNLKDIFEGTKLTEYVQGHQAAAGIGIPEKNIKKFIKETNDIYADVSMEPVYWVDYIMEMKDVDQSQILELANLSYCWGQDIPSSQVAIENIDLNKCSMKLCGQKNNTLRLVLPNGFVMVKFGISQEEFDKMKKSNIYMNCIINPQSNEWEGKITGEGIIDNYELYERWVF